MNVRKYVVYLLGLGGFYCGLQPVRSDGGTLGIAPKVTSDPREARTYLNSDDVADRIDETLRDAGLDKLTNSMIVMSFETWGSTEEI